MFGTALTRTIQDRKRAATAGSEPIADRSNSGWVLLPKQVVEFRRRIAAIPPVICTGQLIEYRVGNRPESVKIDTSCFGVVQSV